MRQHADNSTITLSNPYIPACDLPTCTIDGSVPSMGSQQMAMQQMAIPIIVPDSIQRIDIRCHDTGSQPILTPIIAAQPLPVEMSENMLIFSYIGVFMLLVIAINVYLIQRRLKRMNDLEEARQIQELAKPNQWEKQ